MNDRLSSLSPGSATQNPSSKLRVLLLVTDLDWGGAPLLVHSLAGGLNARGWQVAVCSLAKIGPVGQKMQQEGFPVHSADAKGRWDIACLLRLAAIVRRFRPHVLQTFLMHANVAGRIVGRLTGVPCVVSEICTAEKGARWHLMLEKWSAPWADKIICNSSSVERHIQAAGLPHHKLLTIEHGVDLSRFSAFVAPAADLADLPHPRVLFVGRLDPVKGLDTLADAWRQVQATMPQAQLLIAGDGPLRKLLAGLPNVRMLGFRQDVPALLAGCDLFVLPSKWEGFGLAAAEAMAAGKPVVLTRVEGLQDLVNDGTDGRLVAGNDPPTLAKIVLELLTDPQQCARLGQAARQTAKIRFDDRRMVGEHDFLYRQLLK